MAVIFSNADVDLTLKDEELTRRWIGKVVSNHRRRLGNINYLFCSDAYIYDANVQFLNHDTYTDIITFDRTHGDTVAGDILISVDRVGENATKYGVSFEAELCRVIIHGVLHLLGFADKTDEEALTMRGKEKESLDVLSAM